MKRDDFSCHRRWTALAQRTGTLGVDWKRGCLVLGNTSLMALVQAQHRAGAPAPMGPVRYPREDMGIGASLPFPEHGKRIYSLRRRTSSLGNPRYQVFLQMQTTIPIGDHPDILRICTHVITCTFVYLYANTLCTP